MHNVLYHHGLLTYRVHCVKYIMDAVKKFEKTNPAKWEENTKTLKARVLFKTHILVQLFPDTLCLSPEELGQNCKSLSVGAVVILEIYLSVPLGQGLSPFALQLEKQHAVMYLKY